MDIKFDRSIKERYISLMFLIISLFGVVREYYSSTFDNNIGIIFWCIFAILFLISTTIIFMKPLIAIKNDKLVLYKSIVRKPILVNIEDINKFTAIKLNGIFNFVLSVHNRSDVIFAPSYITEKYSLKILSFIESNGIAIQNKL